MLTAAKPKGGVSQSVGQVGCEGVFKWKERAPGKERAARMPRVLRMSKYPGGRKQHDKGIK